MTPEDAWAKSETALLEAATQLAAGREEPENDPGSHAGASDSFDPSSSYFIFFSHVFQHD